MTGNNPENFENLNYNPYRVFNEILADEGVILDLKIQPAKTASFRWGTVVIPPQDVAKGKDFFFCQTRHEVGHRVVPYAPSTVERALVSAKLAELCGIPKPAVRDFLNVIYDLMVDCTNTGRFREYRKYMRHYIYKNYLRSPDPRMRLLGNVGKLILGEKLGKSQEEKLAREVYDLLFMDGRHFYVKLRELAHLLKPLFTPENQQQYGSFGERAYQSENDRDQQQSQPRNEENPQEQQEQQERSDQNEEQEEQSGQGQGQGGNQDQEESEDEQQHEGRGDEEKQEGGQGKDEKGEGEGEGGEERSEQEQEQEQSGENQGEEGHQENMGEKGEQKDSTGDDVCPEDAGEEKEEGKGKGEGGGEDKGEDKDREEGKEEEEGNRGSEGIEQQKQENREENDRDTERSESAESTEESADEKEETQEAKEEGSKSEGKQERGEEQETKQEPTLAYMKGAIEIPEEVDESEVDLHNLVREMMDAGLVPEDMDAIDYKTHRKLLLTYRRLRLLDHYVEVVERLGNRRSESEELETWRIGDEPKKLEALESVQRHALLLPGVTTLKRAAGSLAGAGGSGSIMLLVDVSGSTAGDVIETERQAAFCIAETARRNGDEIGIITFSTNVVKSIAPTRTEYEEVIEVILEMRFLTFTNISGAASTAYEYIKDKPYSVTTFLITDGRIHDLKPAMPLLRKLNEKGKLVIFLITALQDGKLPQIPQKLVDEGFTTYMIEKGKEFSEEALIELRK